MIVAKVNEIVAELEHGKISPILMMTKSDLADKVGITVPVVNSWIHRYRLPIRKVGQRAYIFLPDFLEWLKEKKVQDKKIY